MNGKRLFSRSIGGAPGRLHLAAHSHHIWPDASRDGQIECWDDAARLADRKWHKVMSEVWPEAQRAVATELGTGDPSAIVFAANTHDFLIRLAAACPRTAGQPLRILTSDGEFHSARRQFARWQEEGSATVERVAAEPFDDFGARFLAAAQRGGHDLILVSQVLFASGRLFGPLEPLAALARPDGPWVIIDAYHAFMAIEAPITSAVAANAFVLGGGYKYAMAGEGMGFMHCPPGYGPRPPLTGWYAEFDDLTLAPGLVGYAPDAMRFMGATFDPSALYRFNAVHRMLSENGFNTVTISAEVKALQRRLLDAVASTALGEAALLNPIDRDPHARFLALRDPRAARWCTRLLDRQVITDVRGDVLRIGLGLYHDDDDIAAFAGHAATLT